MIKRFSRFELKYVVSSGVRDALLPALLAHMRPDECAPGGRYRVTSLYYDTQDLAAYRAKLDGVNFRRKVRIRRYGVLMRGLDSEVMVEIKQRIGRTIQKRRVVVALREAYDLCEGHLASDFDNPKDRSVAEEVAYLGGTLALRPVCVIQYRRMALIGSLFDPGLRITFDEELEVSDPSHGLDEGSDLSCFLRPDHLVIEVKTNDRVPLWVSRLLALHSCEVRRFSKYASGLAHLLETGRGGEPGIRASDARLGPAPRSRGSK